jgi:hypothetical protein
MVNPRLGHGGDQLGAPSSSHVVGLPGKRRAQLANLQAPVALMELTAPPTVWSLMLGRNAVLIGIVAGALMIPGVAGAKKPPAKPPGQVPTLTAGAAPNPVVFGQVTVVSGRLSGTSRNGGQTVQLSSDPFPYGVFAPGPTTLTAPNGNYAFTAVRPDRNTLYRVRETTGAMLTSSVVLVGVRLSVTFYVSDSTPRRGQRVHFSGSVRPNHGGKLVRIQRRDGTGAFRTVASTRTYDPAGRSYSRYSKFLRIYRDGIYRVLVSAGDSDHWSGISRTRFLNVP